MPNGRYLKVEEQRTAILSAVGLPFWMKQNRMISAGDISIRVVGLAVCILSVLAASCSLAGDETETARTYPLLLDLHPVTIDALADSTISPGRYNTEGYAVRIHHCFGPDNMMCAPCAPEGFFLSVVADSLKSLDTYPHAVVFVNVRSFEADQFEQGERYVVSVEVDSRARQAGVLMGVDLLGYERTNDTQAATAGIIHISHRLDH